MADVREKLNEYLKEYLKANPPIIGGGRRTIVMPEPRPEDVRDPYKATGDVPAGHTRAEVVRPNYDQTDPNGRKGSFWVHVMHPGKSNAVLERVFRGDVVDIPDNEYEMLMDRNWVREPWTKKPPEKTKLQAA